MRKILVFMAMGALLTVLAGCGEAKYAQPRSSLPPNGPTQRVGTALIAKSVDGLRDQFFVVGQANVEVLRIVIATSLDEDARLEYLVPEFFPEYYGQALPGLLQNVRIVDQYDRQVGPGSASVMTQEASQYNGWQATTYAWLPADYVIPRGTAQTFRIVVDIPWDSAVYSMTATLSSRTASVGMFSYGIMDRVIIRGVSSGVLMEVHGEAIGNPLYLDTP